MAGNSYVALLVICQRNLFISVRLSCRKIPNVISPESDALASFFVAVSTTSPMLALIQEESGTYCFASFILQFFILVLVTLRFRKKFFLQLSSVHTTQQARDKCRQSATEMLSFQPNMHKLPVADRSCKGSRSEDSLRRHHVWEDPTWQRRYAL